MRRMRVIPVLLLHKGGLVKSIKFGQYKYVGDPINAVKIFNEKEIDEILVLDIDASREGRGPNFEAMKEIAGEAFIPLAYGGGISTIEHVKDLFYLGVEKVVFNHVAFKNPALITEAASLVGSQSVVASIDVKKNWLGKKKVYLENGKENTGEDPIVFAKRLVDAGAGELIINSIDRDGTYGGYDLELIRDVAEAVEVPVVACGGASDIEDFYKAAQNGASAVAAGSMFVFQRPHNAVLISYPSQRDLIDKLYSRI
ncbi:MAG: AglZ/HisF2 family acetamidino modification protein [Chitinophagaceae bacterium]